MTEAILALGSNLGDRHENLRQAVAELEARDVRLLRASSVWETPPVPADQPRYLNAAIAVETALDPHALLATVKAIEHDLGRRPGRRWGPRPIDIDILFYGEETFATDDLTVPHPRIAERAFVLVPLAEVLDGPLPVLGETAAALLAKVDATGVERIGPLLPARD